MRDILLKVTLILSQVSGVEVEKLTDEVVINDSDITSITLIEAIAQIEQDLAIELLPEDLDITEYKNLGDFFRAVERAIKVNDNS